MAGDQRSAWTLTLAPGSPLQRPIKELESGGDVLVVGGVRPWLSSSVAGPVPNRLRGQSVVGEQSVLSSLV